MSNWNMPPGTSTNAIPGQDEAIEGPPYLIRREYYLPRSVNLFWDGVRPLTGRTSWTPDPTKAIRIWTAAQAREWLSAIEATEQSDFSPTDIVTLAEVER
jgi:hypothetical protein